MSYICRENNNDDELKWSALANFCIKTDGIDVFRITDAAWDRPSITYEHAKDNPDRYKAAELTLPEV